MRLPVGFVRVTRSRLARAAKLNRLRVAHAAKRHRLRLARAVQVNRLRLARALVVALFLVLGGGAAAALALLPSHSEVVAERDGAAADRLLAARASATAAPTRLTAQRSAARRARRPGKAYYRKTAARHVAASAAPGFLPLYREAERSFGVSWRLIASIHRQETAFSTAPSTYRGRNAFGCCAGPMQFNVTNGPVSTWKLYRASFRAGNRPRRYPHPTRFHPSVYDDFDAIMAAGALLRDSGAAASLDGGAWSAAYAYYGHDAFGVDYASQVVARAAGWERDGFCLNCAVDGSLIAEFDDAYGVDARSQLAADDRNKREKGKKHKKRRSAAARAKAAEKAAAKAADEAARREAPDRPAREGTRPARPPASSPPPPSTSTKPAATAPPPPATSTQAPPATTPTPADQGPCTPLSSLLGCSG